MEDQQARSSENKQIGGSSSGGNGIPNADLSAGQEGKRTLVLP